MSKIYFLILTITLFFPGCNTYRPKKSKEDLRIAFNLESTNTEKYSKYAQAATREGLDTIAQLFEAFSKSESIHAANHGKVLEKFGGDTANPEIGAFEVKSTTENLKAAIKGATFDMQTIYPVYIRDAEQEKIPEIARSFIWAWNGEKKQFVYLSRAQAALNKMSQVNLPYIWLVCPTCGNTFSISDVKAVCDFCLTKQDNFIGYRKTAD